MDKYEYDRTFCFNDNLLNAKQLDDYGSEGWELCAIDVIETGRWYIFKCKIIC